MAVSITDRHCHRRERQLRAGDFTVRIREDRLPAPLLAAYFQDGSSLAVSQSESSWRHDRRRCPRRDRRSLVDERFQFGAIARREGGEIRLGYWFPGTRER